MGTTVNSLRPAVTERKKGPSPRHATEEKDGREVIIGTPFQRARMMDLGGGGMSADAEKTGGHIRASEEETGLTRSHTKGKKTAPANIGGSLTRTDERHCGIGGGDQH